MIQDAQGRGVSEAKAETIRLYRLAGDTIGGLRDVAVAMAHERLGTRPRGAVNRDFLRRAEGIAA